MTVETVTASWGPYVGNGIVSVFPYLGRIFDAENLVVTKRNLSDHSSIILALNTDYTVSGVDSPLGGNVTLPAPLAVGFDLLIERILEFTQETDIKNQGAFHAEIHEDVWDRLVMYIQQLKSSIDALADAGGTGPKGDPGPQGPQGDPGPDDHNILSNLDDNAHPQYQLTSAKGAVSGYASLDAGSKVPTVQLGGAGADNTKFLRGDGTWATVSAAGESNFTTSILNADTAPVNNSTVLVDSGLSFTVVANKTYHVEFDIYYIADVAADLKMAIVGTATTVGKVGFDLVSPILTDFTTPGAVVRGGTGANAYTKGSGIIKSGATGGIVKLQFAQGTAHVSDTKLLMNSVLRVQLLD